jgi:putative inorganic carbon (hco3(-)) transporter
MFFFCVVALNALEDASQVKLLIVVMCASFFLVNRAFYSLMSGRDLSHFSYEARDAGPLGYAGENGLAAFEAMVTAFLVGMYAYERKLLVKLALLGLIVTGIYCLLFSFSRGGYLGFLAALVVVGILKQRKLLLLVGVLLLVWQTVLPASVQERITMTTEDAVPGGQLDSSSEQRVRIWTDAAQLLKQNPITGTGFDTYQFLGRVESFHDTHNYYMKVLVETGVVGLSIFLWLFSRLWRAGLELYRSASALDPFWGGVGLGFLALTASAAVANFFGDRWTYQQVCGWLWILLGCVLRGLILVRRSVEQTPAQLGVGTELATAASG